MRMLTGRTATVAVNPDSAGGAVGWMHPVPLKYGYVTSVNTEFAMHSGFGIFMARFFVDNYEAIQYSTCKKESNTV